MKKFIFIICSISLLLLGCGNEKQIKYVTETKVIQGQEVPEKKQVEKTQEVTPVEKIEEPKLKTSSTEENSSAIVEKTATLSEDKPIEADTVATTAVEEKVSSTETKEDVTPLETSSTADSSSKKYSFSNGFNLKVLDAPGNGKSIDSLRKNTRVSITETKTVGDKTPVEYAKIEYKKDGKSRSGWINTKSLTPKITDSIPKEWNSLNFSPRPKVNYPGNPKKVVKGIYVSYSSVSTTKSLDRLIDLANKTEINAFVIDVKDDDGLLLWKMPEVVSKYNLNSDAKAPIKDISAVMKKLKDNNIYLIARIVSFKDPTYAKVNPDRTIIDKRNGKPFTNADGLVWVSAHDRKLWQYNIDVAKEAAKVGFNEIQFDYVRFPASNGGKLDAVLNYRNPNGESKPVAIQKYLIEAHKQLSPLNVYTAADVYGQVGSSPDDMSLGQYWEAVSNVVDYICPMVYPSHYANGVYGTKVPDAEPYKTVYGSSRDSVNRNYNIDTPATIRTWIQDFTASWVKGHIKYDITEVKLQIKALNDLGLQEYILWNAGNRYSME